ncbi:hypothetical protein B0O99DRAFT_483569, partial [Bisporella sp. PMI_857]
NNNHDTSLLSPFNYTQNLSSSASPSYNPNSNTPGESLSEYSNYQTSELGEVDDEFFGVDFSAGVQRIDSLPSNYLDSSYQPANHSLPYPPPQTQEHQVESLNPLAYPLSPKLTSIPNTPSPRLEAHEPKTQTTISQQELNTELHNSRFQPFAPHPQSHPSTIELTPEHSGSSHTSAEGVAPSNMANFEQSPIVTVSQWSNQFSQYARPTETAQFDSQQGAASTNRDMGSPHPTQATGIRDDEGNWVSDQATGQAGLGPEQRKIIADVEVPNLKEQAEQRRIEIKNIEVEEWRSQAGESSGEENSEQTYFHFTNTNWQQSESGRRRSPPEDDNNIAPVDDAISLHENRLVEGQIYYHPNGRDVSDADFELMRQPRHWSDAPMLPQITMTKFQPLTANEAIKRWNDNADTISLTSRVATWGTRRRSETNLTDMEGVTDGSFLKKLSISRSRDGSRPRQNSIFDQVDRFTNIVRNRSDSRLKRSRGSQDITEDAGATNARHNSQDTLAPPRPPNYNRRSMPNVTSAVAAMTGPIAAVGTTHTRSGSISAVAPSTKSPTIPSKNLGFARSVIQRARSRSELSAQEKAPQPGIVNLWKSQGGPPVASLASPPLDMEDDDDDDEPEQVDEADLGPESEQETEPITPNYEGFKDHVRRLNPDMDPRYKWLVSRIAHQQEIRYKNLLDLRVKHSQATITRTCGAGRFCIASGGGATLIDAHGKPREQEAGSSSLHLVTDFSDHDSNPGEGALNEETFPPGVPMPPSRHLPAEFECQLCFKSKKFQKPSDWTKHVHEDVQPFTCTYDKCKEPKSFKRKADWVRHENERHRHLEWWICQVEDCRHPCYRKDNFLQHLVREHKLPEPKQKTKAAIKKARLTEPAWVMLERCHHETQNKPQDEPCKFCGKTFNTWKKLTVHLAKHMEHISLPVLKLVEAKHVDANTIISPVEQILTPVTPIGRQKMESTSPFNMGSISPHIPLNQQFTSGMEQPSYYPTTSSSAPYEMQPPILPFGQHQMYSDPYDVQQMTQPRAFSSMNAGPTNLNSMH